MLVFCCMWSSFTSVHVNSRACIFVYSFIIAIQSKYTIIIITLKGIQLLSSHAEMVISTGPVNNIPIMQWGMLMSIPQCIPVKNCIVGILLTCPIVDWNSQIHSQNHLCYHWLCITGYYLTCHIVWSCLLSWVSIIHIWHLKVHLSSVMEWYWAFIYNSFNIEMSLLPSS